jgi:hypothetical protein
MPTHERSLAFWVLLICVVGILFATGAVLLPHTKDRAVASPVAHLLYPKSAQAGRLLVVHFVDVQPGYQLSGAYFRQKGDPGNDDGVSGFTFPAMDWAGKSFLSGAAVSIPIVRANVGGVVSVTLIFDNNKNVVRTVTTNFIPVVAS